MTESYKGWGSAVIWENVVFVRSLAKCTWVLLSGEKCGSYSGSVIILILAVVYSKLHV